MKTDLFEPWYALVEAGGQTVFNRPRTAVKINKPTPKPPKPSQSTIIYRSAIDVIMELTVAIRKDLDGSVPFKWSPDDYYAPLCVSWYEEQKKRGIRDIVFLCGDEGIRATGKFYECCMVCWYADGGVACFMPGQEGTPLNEKPVIKEVDLAHGDYQKPVFHDNGRSFKEALLAIAEFASFQGWKNRFKSGYHIMENDNLTYCGQKDAFPIPKPYFKFLLAAQVTRLGVGMGSWFDLPVAGTESFKAITKRFSAEQCKALMYAINNC